MVTFKNNSLEFNEEVRVSFKTFCPDTTSLHDYI